MDISTFLKKACIVFLLPLLFGCGGGGDIDTYPSPNISVSSSYDYGGIVLDNVSDKKFVVTNTGTEPLKIGSISLPFSSFSIIDDTCSNKTLGVNQTCSVITRFSPIDDGSFVANVSIPSNDPDGKKTIRLSGEGYGLNVWINKIEAVDCVVTVDVTVTSPRIPGVLNTLTEDNFDLYENGKHISAINVSGIIIPSPVSVVLAIDWSGSVIGIIDTIKTAANSFVNNLDPTSDEAAACKFNATIEFEPPGPDPLFYPDPVVDWLPLTDYITEHFTGSDGTRLYDAVYQSIDWAVLGGKDKKVVIVLSDGVDVASGDIPPGSYYTLAEVIAHATAKKIPVFTIYYAVSDSYGKPEVMEQMAGETGGQYYNGAVDLTDVYQQIFDILYSQYRITYTSSICTGDVSLDVLADYYWVPPGQHLYGQDSGMITFTLP